MQVITEKAKKRKISFEGISSAQMQNNSSLSNANQFLDQELRSKLKKMKTDCVPELKELIRIYQIICLCKTAAFELYQSLVNSNWKSFRMWM
jgi:hypothetical protein